MENYKITSLLFEGKPIINICGSGNPVISGTQGNSGMGLSKIRPANAKGRAKFNRIAVALDRIFIDCCLKGVITSNEGVYLEYTSNSTGENYGVYSTISELKYIGNADPSPNGRALAMLASCIAAPQNCPYLSGKTNNTSELLTLFRQIKSDYSNDNVAKTEDVLTLCDNIYYTLKDLGAINISDNAITVEEIQQAIRNRQFTSVPELSEYLDFANVEFIDLPFEATNDVCAPADETWSKIKDGEFQIGYEWTSEQMLHIPNSGILDKFVPTEEFYSLFNRIKYDIDEVLTRIDLGKSGIEAIGENYVNAIMLGKPGTGKTTIAEAVAAALGIPIRTIVTSKNTEEDNYEGKNKIIEGGFKFCETAFLDVYKNGGIAVIEEFNLADPAVIMGALGQALVPPFVLMEDGVREVHRHPMCIIIATMNTATQGSREPNEAFTSRLPKVYLMDDPKEEDFIHILESKGNDRAMCQKVYSLYSSVVSYLNESSYEQEAMSLTIRQCLEALKDIKRGIPIKRAVKETIVNSLAIKDVCLAKEVYEAVIEPSPIR